MVSVAVALYPVHDSASYVMKATDATERPTELHNPLYIVEIQCRGGYSVSLYSLALSQASKGLRNRYSPASR